MAIDMTIRRIDSYTNSDGVSVKSDSETAPHPSTGASDDEIDICALKRDLETKYNLLNSLVNNGIGGKRSARLKDQIADALKDLESIIGAKDIKESI